jgi:hypothetical protein
VVIKIRSLNLSAKVTKAERDKAALETIEQVVGDVVDLNE